MRFRLLVTCLLTFLSLPADANAGGQGRSPLRVIGTSALDISELRHDTNIRLRGLFADVATTQSAILTSAAASGMRSTDVVGELIYTFALPSSAAVTGLSIRLANGRMTRAVIVDATAAAELATRPKGAKEDVGLLRLVELDGPIATYELRIFPIGEAKAISWTIEWRARLVLEGGRAVLRVPARGRYENLVTENVSVRGEAPAGFAGFESLTGSGKSLGSRFPVHFKGSLFSGIVVELVPRSTTPIKPTLEFATTQLRGGRSALLYSIFAPPQPSRTAPAPQRLLLIVDVSKSMGHARQTAEQVMAALLAAAPNDLGVDAIVFARDAKAVFGAFRPNRDKNRSRLLAAVRATRPANGSNFIKAISLAETLLASQSDGARIVILTDALTPISQTPRVAADAGAKLLQQQVSIAQVTLVAAGAPLPRRANMAGAALIRTGKGRLLTLRAKEAQHRKADLWDTLFAPPPLEDIRLDVGDAFLGSEPGTLPAGDAAFGVGFVRRKAAGALSAEGAIDDGAVRLKGRYRRDLESSVIPFLLAPMQEPPDGFDDISLASLATKSPVVTKRTALWAPYPGDRFAADRIALARRWGIDQFRRVAPSLEAVEDMRPYFFSSPAPLVHAPPTSHRIRATGKLTVDILRRLLQTQVVPKVRGCYRRALLPAKNLRGELGIVVEIARGEVQAARIDGALTGSTKWAAEVESCALDAAYSLRPPRVRQGSEEEAISVVRYPLRFHIVDSRGRVVEADTSKPADPGDPLDGL